MRDATAKLEQVLQQALEPVLSINVVGGDRKHRSDAERRVASAVVELARILRRFSYPCAFTPWSGDAAHVIVGMHGEKDDGGRACVDTGLFWSSGAICLGCVHYLWTRKDVWIVRGDGGYKRSAYFDVLPNARVGRYRIRDFIAWAHPATIATVDAMAQSLFKFVWLQKRDAKT